jgi:hypothetical protein
MLFLQWLVQKSRGSSPAAELALREVYKLSRRPGTGVKVSDVAYGSKPLFGKVRYATWNFRGIAKLRS